jgi:hypothetical protein
MLLAFLQHVSGAMQGVQMGAPTLEERALERAAHRQADAGGVQLRSHGTAPCPTSSGRRCRGGNRRGSSSGGSQWSRLAKSPIISSPHCSRSTGNWEERAPLQVSQTAAWLAVPAAACWVQSQPALPARPAKGKADMLMSLYAWQGRESGDEGLNHHLRLPLFNANTGLCAAHQDRT